MSAKRMAVSLLPLLAGFLASSGPLYAGICRITPDRGPDAVPPQIIPLKIFKGFLLVVEARLGGSPQPQNFILDTGTAPSIINVTLVEQLGLATTAATLSNIGKIIPTRASTLSEIDLGPIRAISLPVQVEDLSQVERDFGIPIAGILGLDVLSKSSFRLDYEKREIEFGDISHVGIPAHFDERSGLAVTEARIEGRAARMLVDTGTDRVVLLGGNFADLGWLAPRNTSQSGRSFVDRKMPVQVFSAPDIILGEQHFSKERAYLVPISTDPLFDGLLGVRALGFQGLSYDQACGTIYLQK